jgi:hypothetical protein
MHDHDMMEEIFPEEELMESEEAFLVMAPMFSSARTVEQLVNASGLDPEIVDDVLGMGTGLGIFKKSSAKTPRFSVNWKSFSRYFLEGAVGLDTEISLMVDAYSDDDEEPFEQFADRANDMVTEFTRELSTNPEFVDLLKSYLKLLVGEFLVDDPKLYDLALADAALSFESLLTKIGGESLKARSSKHARLLRSIRAWAHHASEVNMLAEVALLEVMDEHGLLRS